ncbi:FecR domain-containing protein [Pseudomonas sp. Gutcm_11s]|uniref:FecR domain-containing protein n=1 Tax=Pseudomonas sp. Gutcm_11s TaxID=3026088 RepID=UPI0023624F54|nr:FecR domain-containing protein [Pseudomonas sp. Gutcm_11s]MDD0844881.1 FecR domain-containing protein [Pseudomonas sp. Gutcm_11s]
MKAVLGEAVDWYVRLNDSTSGEQTQAEWRHWLAADARHAEAWTRMEQLQRSLGQAPAGITGQTLEQARRSRRTVLKGLATLAGVGLLGWQGYRVSPFSADYATRIGERRSLTLADGSRLQLDTDTRIDLRFDAAQRQIRLLQGNLLVDAASDNRPFNVISAEGLVHTQDARFAVRQFDGRTQVLVERLAVQIIPSLSPPPAVSLAAGQGLSFDARACEAAQPAPVDACAWTNGMLVAVDWRLDALLTELSRYHHGYLGCSPEVAGLRLSGAFAVDDLDAVLHLLQESLPLRARQVTRLWTHLERHPA